MADLGQRPDPRGGAPDSRPVTASSQARKPVASSRAAPHNDRMTWTAPQPQIDRVTGDSACLP